MVQTVEVPRAKKNYFPLVSGLALAEGILTIALGLYLLFRPEGPLEFLLGVLGGYWLLSGVFKCIASLAGARLEWWWTRLAGGMCLSVAGVFILLYPFYSSVSVLVISSAAAFLAMTGGILTASWGMVRGGIAFGEGWVMTSGLLSVLLGFVLLFAPYIPAKTVDGMIAAMAFLAGTGEIAAALALRRRASR